MSNVTHSLIRIGAVQFGQFEQQPGVFAPLAINLRIVPSYPEILKTLAEEIAPLVRIEGLTHLLTTPAAVPIGVAISMAASIPLVYPSAGDPRHIEGAYDFNEPTVLLTDVLRDGEDEQKLIDHVRGLGLDVKAVIAVIDLGICAKSDKPFPAVSWRKLDELLPEMPASSPSMRAVVRDWLMLLARP
jgi:uridine monophosphate synthetase